MAGEKGKNMTFDQFTKVLEIVMEKHSWHKGLESHIIKYVRPHFDTRSGDFYGVTFEGARGVLKFFVVNEDKDRDLFEWIMEFLNTPPNIVVWDDISTR